MQKLHMHTPAWMRHIHKPDWHTVGPRLEHLIHDPRFWAAVALAVLAALMILTSLLSDPSGYTPSTTYIPVYPLLP